jgi:hypothetical protein
MAILYCGGELEDVAAVGTVAFSTSAGFRSAYARGRLDAVAASGQPNYVKVSFLASATFGVTGRFSQITSYSANAIIMSLAAGGNARLRLRLSTAANTSTLYIEKFDGSSSTTLGTSTLTLAAGTSNVYKIDVLVNYAALGGYVRVYVDQTEYISYSGDPTAGGSTSLDEVRLSGGYNVSTGGWSEIIVASEDTRPLSLKTLNPNAAGDVTEWTGAYTDIDDITASDADTASSGTAGQILTTESTGMPAGGSGEAIRMVKIVASALRGAAGPQKIQIGVKSGSTYGWSPDLALDTGYTPVSHTLTTDPATGQPFAREAITALKFAMKSVA